MVCPVELHGSAGGCRLGGLLFRELLDHLVWQRGEVLTSLGCGSR